MKRVFKTRHFQRWMRKSRLTDAALCEAVEEMIAGLIDADLGGGVVKKRIGLSGRGKRGGARTLLATNKGTRWFFVFGFEKTNARISVTANSMPCRVLLPICLPERPANSTLRWPTERYRRFVMATKAKAKSAILGAVHETAADLHRLGFIDKRKMQKYEALCLEPVPEYDAAKIRALRARFHLSQAVLAAALNTSSSTVRKWEIGDKRPSGPSQKLLNLIDRKGLEAVL